MASGKELANLFPNKIIEISSLPFNFYSSEGELHSYSSLFFELSTSYGITEILWGQIWIVTSGYESCVFFGLMEKDKTITTYNNYQGQDNHMKTIVKITCDTVWKLYGSTQIYNRDGWTDSSWQYFGGVFKAN